MTPIVNDIKLVFKDLIEKYSLVEELLNNNKFVLSNENFKLIFVDQSLEGIELYFENSLIKTSIGFLIRIYNNADVPFLTYNKNVRKEIQELNYLYDTIVLFGSFLIDGDQYKIKNYLKWKKENQHRIIEGLLKKRKENNM